MSERIYADRKYVESLFKQSDWDQNDSTAADYVKNRTHWKEITEQQVLFSEANLVFSADNSNIIEQPVDFELVLGSDYMITIDDESHTYTAGEDSYGIVYIGDLDGNITASVYDGVLQIQLAESGTHSIKILHIQTDCYFAKWFAKASQPDWEESDENSINYINNKPFGRTVTADSSERYIRDVSGNDSLLTFELYGDCYRSSIDGVIDNSTNVFGFVPNHNYNISLYGNRNTRKYYSVTSKFLDLLDMVAIGNASLALPGWFEDTGEDFVILGSQSEKSIIVVIKAALFSEIEETNRLKIGISGVYYKYNVINNAYLPSTIARVSDIPEVDYPVTSVNGQTGDVSIEIPDSILTPITASIGQTIVVKSVDENGKPTEWETVDPWVMPSSTEGSTKQFKLSIDDNGTLTITEIVVEEAN